MYKILCAPKGLYLIMACLTLFAISCQKDSTFLDSSQNVQKDDELASKVKEFQAVANLDNIKNGIQERTTFTRAQMEENLSLSANYSFTKADFPQTETESFVDSMDVPRQSGTFNTNSAAYSKDMVEYFARKHYSELTGTRELLYVKVYSAESGTFTTTSGDEKFYITTTFGIKDASAPITYPWPDMSLEVYGGNSFPFPFFPQFKSNVSTTRSVPYHVERALNFKNGIIPISTDKYFSEIKNVGFQDLAPSSNIIPVQTNPGLNPNYLPQLCWSDKKRCDYPTVSIIPVYNSSRESFLQVGNSRQFESLRTDYYFSKNDAIYWYNKADQFFINSTPSGFVRINCELFNAAKPGTPQLPFASNADGIAWNSGTVSNNDIFLYCETDIQAFGKLKPQNGVAVNDPNFGQGGIYVGVFGKISIRNPNDKILIDQIMSKPEVEKYFL